MDSEAKLTQFHVKDLPDSIVMTFDYILIAVYHSRPNENLLSRTVPNIFFYEIQSFY